MPAAAGGRSTTSPFRLPACSITAYHLRRPERPAVRRRRRVTFGQQRQQMLIDPSFASPSTGSTATFGDLSLTTQLPGNVTQLTHIDHGRQQHDRSPPPRDGKLDIAGTSHASLTGYTLKMTGSGQINSTLAAVAVVKGQRHGDVTTLTRTSRATAASQLLHVLTRKRARPRPCPRSRSRAPRPLRSTRSSDRRSHCYPSFADLMTSVRRSTEQRSTT